MQGQFPPGRRLLADDIQHSTRQAFLPYRDQELFFAQDPPA